MSTRISTSGMHTSVLSQLMKQQSTLARTQAQVASGKRFQTPAEDPIAATRVVDLERSQAQLTQYGKNANILSSRLTITEQAFADVGTSLQRVRELALQANSGALDEASLKSIATELQQRVLELQDVGNRRDTNGEYLFSGYSSNTQPFARTTTGVSFAGDRNSRQLQIGPSQSLADSIDGYRAFVGIPEGNGVFTVANGTHTGTAVVDTGQVINPAAWVPGNYTISFDAAGTWTVTDFGERTGRDGHVCRRRGHRFQRRSGQGRRTARRRATRSPSRRPGRRACSRQSTTWSPRCGRGQPTPARAPRSVRTSTGP